MKQKQLMVSNFALSLVVFKWHHSSEVVKEEADNQALRSKEKGGFNGKETDVTGQGGV